MSNILICGRIKQGKTTLAIYLAKKISRGNIAWDPRHMIQGPTYVFNADSLEDAIEDGKWQQGLIVFRPDGLRLKEDFQTVCQVLFTPPNRFKNFVFIVDEAAQLQTSHSIEPYLDVAVRQHPRSATLIQTTHSLQDWHRASKDLMSDLYCFRLQGRSLKAVLDYCDGNEQMESDIKCLPEHHVLHYSFENGGYEIMSDPKLWYSAATKGSDERSPGEEEDMATKKADGTYEFTDQEETDIAVNSESLYRANRRLKAEEKKEKQDADCRAGNHPSFENKKCQNCGAEEPAPIHKRRAFNIA